MRPEGNPDILFDTPLVNRDLTNFLNEFLITYVESRYNCIDKKS